MFFSNKPNKSQTIKSHENHRIRSTELNVFTAETISTIPVPQVHIHSENPPHPGCNRHKWVGLGWDSRSKKWFIILVVTGILGGGPRPNTYITDQPTNPLLHLFCCSCHSMGSVFGDRCLYRRQLVEMFRHLIVCGDCRWLVGQLKGWVGEFVGCLVGFATYTTFTSPNWKPHCGMSQLNCAWVSHQLHPAKITWKWKFTYLKMYFLVSEVEFHC